MANEETLEDVRISVLALRRQVSEAIDQRDDYWRRMTTAEQTAAALETQLTEANFDPARLNWFMSAGAIFVYSPEGDKCRLQWPQREPDQSDATWYESQRAAIDQAIVEAQLNAKQFRNRDNAPLPAVPQSVGEEEG